MALNLFDFIVHQNMTNNIYQELHSQDDAGSTVASSAPAGYYNVTACINITNPDPGYDPTQVIVMPTFTIMNGAFPQSYNIPGKTITANLANNNFCCIAYNIPVPSTMTQWGMIWTVMYPGTIAPFQVTSAWHASCVGSPTEAALVRMYAAPF